MQGHRFAGVLAEWRSQSRCDADQVRVQQQFDVAFPDRHLGTVGGGSGQLVEQREFDASPHLVHADTTVGDHQHLAALHAALDLEGSAEQGGVDLGDAQILLRELQAAAELSQGRQRGIDIHLVGQKGVCPLDLRLAESCLGQWNEQRDVQAALAAGAHVVGEVIDLVRHRTLLDERQEFRRVALGVTLDAQRRHRRIEIGDLSARLR